MRFYDKKEYCEKKELLTGDYLENFERVRDFFFYCSPNKYVQEECIFKTLDDFIAAQENNTPVDKVYNNNMSKYCNDILKYFSNLPQYRTVKNLDKIVIYIVLIIFSISFKSYFKTKNFYSFEIGSFEIIVVIFAFLYEKLCIFIHKLIVKRKVSLFTFIFLRYVFIYLILFYVSNNINKFSKFNIKLHIYVYVLLIIFSIILFAYSRILLKKSKV